MLRTLRIHDLALIEAASVDFYPGFTAVTGETGAGKSIFLLALRLLSGHRAPGQLVRQGKNRALVEAVFELQNHQEALYWLTEHQIDVEKDGEVIIQREILLEGKSRARINGVLVSQGDLGDFGKLLVQFHGQSEQVLLRDLRTHLKWVDLFGNHENTLGEYQKVWHLWQQKCAELKSLLERAAQLATQREFLQFQAEELSKARLIEGEEASAEEWLQQANAKLAARKFMDAALEQLEGENSLQNAAAKLAQRMRLWRERDENISPLENRVQQLMAEAEDISLELRKQARQQNTIDEAELEKVNGRLALIQRLKRKYRSDFQGLLDLRDRRQQELQTLDSLDMLLQEAQKTQESSYGQVLHLGKKLSYMRAQAATQLDALVQERLEKLGMQGAQFKTVFSSESEGSIQGLELAEFFIAPNRGEGPKPLRQAVSGGELSRVLLAFKSVLAERDSVPVLIFDEVDSGISGEVAHQIAHCLHSLGRFHQVLSITHLHQVASKAHSQIGVYKQEIAERTLTNIAVLEPSQRIRELARMLGNSGDATVLAHARQLLEVSHEQT